MRAEPLAFGNDSAGEELARGQSALAFELKLEERERARPRGDRELRAFGANDRARRLLRFVGANGGAMDLEEPRAQVVNVPGQGVNARTERSISTAGFVQSILPSSLRTSGASVASSSRCGIGVTAPRTTPSSVVTRAAAPISESRLPRDSAVSSGEIAVSCIARMSPASIRSFICMIVIPVTDSPARIARWIGAAPRYFGSSEP